MIPKVLEVRAAGPEHQVVSVSSGSHAYRREPCPGCPWRVDNTGIFPPQAFQHSARTAYDLSEHVFGCHESGTEKSATCAGFLLRGAAHNLRIRMGYCQGRFADKVTDGGHRLHENYVAMAVANGVDPEDPALAPCRS